MRLVLPAFLLVSVGGGALVGLSVDTTGWYADLAKPPFNPPDWVFPPVWTALYVLIGIAGWRVWRIRDRVLLGLWWAQLAANFGWVPVFFTLHQPLSAAAILVALVTMIGCFVYRARPRERTAAMLFVPYLAWAAFALYLNIGVAVLNGPEATENFQTRTQALDSRPAVAFVKNRPEGAR